MTGRLVSRFCDFCGRRFDLSAPEPGELGLDRIGTVFRSCATCGRSVGIVCCWDQAMLACVDCASTRKARVIATSRARQKGEGPAVRRALAQLSAAVLGLQRFGRDRRLNGQLTILDWEDAWWEAGWLILNAESRGDAAVERLRASRATKANAAHVAEFDALVDAYGQARGHLEARLVAVGRPLRHQARHALRPLRGTRLAVATGLFVVALTVTTVMAAASILGTTMHGVAPISSSGAEQRAGGVLGTSQAQATPAPGASTRVRALVAMLNFDVLRIGPLAGASSDLARVIGHAEVASFPSPFDRSIRLSGAGPDGFCLANDHLSGGGVSVTVDLYAEEAVTTGSLELVATAPDGFVTVASIPERVLRRLSAERWYRVSAEWMPGTREVIDVSERGLGTLFVDSLDLAAGSASSDPHGLCVWALGMPGKTQLLLDNLHVEQ